eukprot:s3744_g1.t2
MRPRKLWPWLAAASTAASQGTGTAKSWRLVNTEAVELSWRISSLQFFADLDCTEPVHSLPQTGQAFGTEASELTTVEHAFMLNTPRGWEAAGSCPPRECHLGFSFAAAQNVECLVVQQGDDGFHAPALALQRQDVEGAAWSDVTAWGSLGPGRSKLAVGCPDPPAVPSASVSACRSDNLLFQECRVACKEGFGTLETSMRCVNGAWFVPQCWALGPARGQLRRFSAKRG